MMPKILLAVLVVGLLMTGAGGRAAGAQDDDQQIDALLQHVAELLRTGDAAGYAALLDETADLVRADDFAQLAFARGVTRSVLKERSREEVLSGLPGTYRLTVDAFAESGDRGRVATWQLDLRKNDENQWRVVDQAPLSIVENLYRLSVNPAKQFDARNFTLRAEDVDMTLAEGSVFVVETNQGPSALILLGRGDLRFHPPSNTEKGQVKIFAGAETLETRFDSAFVRVGELSLHADLAQLTARPVDPRELRRAEQIFREESGKSFVVQLDDLSPDTWSLLPPHGDFLTEVRTRRFGTLTYSRSSVEAEDISVFDRERKKTISTYASAAKLAAHGGSYNEDDLSDYDILDHDIDLTVDPERQWIEGQATLRLAIRAPFISHLTIKLADTLAVKSVVSDEFGWLFSLRVKNQNTIFVNLPAGAARDTRITLRIAYSGRLSPQSPDRETIETGLQDPDAPPPPPASVLPEMPSLPDEPRYLYSNRSYWYPQAPSSDYATATIQLSVPASLSCVASGGLVSGSPAVVPQSPSSQGRKLYQFAATRPVRYLAFVVSRFTRSEPLAVTFDGSSAGLDVAIEANPRQRHRARGLAADAADIARFYESVVGDVPYESFTVALVDATLPGGHSPGYFALLNQPEISAPILWRNDPANFDGYPEFFLAHELAHQWWGQAVGWGSYHDQWLSEGFAQYFAALYAQHRYGQNAFESALQHLRRWSLEQSAQGPVYLGYRLGHIKSDSRVFRAVVYNKGAAVLHMLRRLVGDDVFFRGLRRFYTEQRFQKATTQQFRQAMEQEAGRPLDRFFEQWIYGTVIPRITYSYRLESVAGGPNVAVLHVEQTGETFDIPLTVTLQYADRRTVRVVVPVTERTVDARLALDGQLRSLDISKDDGTLAEAAKAP